MVQLPIGALGHGPSLPSIRLIDDEAIWLAVEFRF